MNNFAQPLRMLSLCSGIGCIDLAAQLAGVEIAGQVEIDPFCQQVLAKHWPDVKRMSDIKEVTGDEFGRIDIVAGGIPCQPFSKAGKRKGAADDRHLWPYAYSIIKNALPTWVIIENVDDFISMAFDVVASDLESQGYEVQAYVLPACAVDAPHYRQRCFIVAHAGYQRSRIWQESQREQTWAKVISRSEILENSIDPRCSTTRDISAPSISRWQESRRQQSTSGTGRSGQGDTPLVNTSGARCTELDTATLSGNESLVAWRSDAHRAARLSQSQLGGDTHGSSPELDNDRRNGGMDGDSLALAVLSDGGIEVDFETGLIYSRRIRGKEGQQVHLQGANTHGYITHKISYKGIKKPVRAHRIIWIASHGLIPEGLMIDHINRDKADNRLVNLRLVDAKGNAANRPSLAGENNPAVKFTPEQIQEVRTMRTQGMYIRDIAKVCGISKSQVYNIVSNLSWKEDVDDTSPFIEMDRLDRHQWPALPGHQQYDGEPPRTITARLPHRNKRLKALGNGVVWQQIYPIFSAIAHIERERVASLDYKNDHLSSSILWTEAHGSEAM